MDILLVEDNESIIKGLTFTFTQNNYNVTYKANIKDTLEYLNTNSKIDLIILDITLPDGDGFVVFKNHIKKFNIPTIFLTAKDEEDIVVECLENGAEDYITKPFSTKELIARINKILCRFKSPKTISIKNIKYDMDKMIVYRDSEIVELTSLELKLLNMLFLDIGKVVKRNTILDKIWEWTGNYVDDHTVTVYFNRIREKLNSDIIVTVKGIGYRIDEE